MKNCRFITKTFLLVAISISFTAFVFGQNSEILVDGNPPFTQSNFDEIVKYYERGLAIRFSGEERDELQSRITTMWRKNQKSKGREMADFMKSVRRMNTIDGEKIKAHQHEFVDALLADLKNMSRNGWSDFVVNVYENAQNNESASNNELNEESSSQTETTSKNETTKHDEPNFQPISGTVKMSDLIGKWVKGTAATYGYRNTVTNDYRSGYGAANQHDIYAGGNFDYTNYAQVSGYGCTTELYTSMKGRAVISGSQITFNYASGTVRIEDSCKKSSVTKPAQIKNTTYQIERDGSHLRMCEIGAENPTCLYKEEN